MSYKRIVKIILRNPVVEALIIFLLILASIYAYAGTWPAISVVESTSMMHPDNNPFYLGTLEPGDILVLKKFDGNVVTYEEGKLNGYRRFGDYGDVIIYRNPYTETLIVHRAIRWVEEGEIIVDSSGTWKAPWSGYITKGDNNYFTDQESGIMYHKPVKPSWIVAKAGFEIPYLGVLKLYMMNSNYVSRVPPTCKIMAIVMYISLLLVPILIEVIISTYRKIRIWKEKNEF